jgi:hypothetical protein
MASLQAWLRSTPNIYVRSLRTSSCWSNAYPVRRLCQRSKRVTLPLLILNEQGDRSTSDHYTQESSRPACRGEPMLYSPPAHPRHALEPADISLDPIGTIPWHSLVYVLVIVLAQSSSLKHSAEVQSSKSPHRSKTSCRRPLQVFILQRRRGARLSGSGLPLLATAMIAKGPAY